MEVSGSATLKEREALPAEEPSKLFTSMEAGSAMTLARTTICCRCCTAVARGAGLETGPDTRRPTKLGNACIPIGDTPTDAAMRELAAQFYID